MPHSAPMFLHNNTHLGLSDDETYYGLITDLLRINASRTLPERIPNTSHWRPEAESRAKFPSKHHILFTFLDISNFCINFVRHIKQ